VQEHADVVALEIGDYIIPPKQLLWSGDEGADHAQRKPSRLITQILELGRDKVTTV
jgi:hypothetical protein